MNIIIRADGDEHAIEIPSEEGIQTCFVALDPRLRGDFEFDLKSMR
jgi:hypothetical protein